MTTNTTNQRKVEDHSINPEVTQEFSIEVNEASDAQKVRREIEKVSGNSSVKSLVSGLKRHNG